MAQITLFKELIKQVACETIPGAGFTQADLDQVKACVAKVQPIETQDFNPDISFDNDQQNQADCIAGANEEVKKIISEEQRKIPNAIRYSALRGKIQELRDNVVIVKDYYDERYSFFTSVLDQTQAFTAEYLYWTDEYDRLTQAVSSSYLTAVASTTSITIQGFIERIRDSSNDIQSTSIRDNLLKLNDNLDNIIAVTKALGATTVSANAFGNRISDILANPKIMSYLATVKARIVAYTSQTIAKGSAIKAQADRIQGLTPLPDQAILTQALIQSELSKVSRQLTAKFIDSTNLLDLTNITGLLTKPIVPNRTTGIKFRLISKDQVSIKITQFNDQGVQLDDKGAAVQVDELIAIENSPVLQRKTIFKDRLGLAIEGIAQYVEGQSSNPPREDSDYRVLSGLLYNGISGNSYRGLYTKLGKPINLLFTLEERGLTVNPNAIDPIFNGIKDAPTSVREDDVTYYINNQAAYESFYDKLPEEYPKRIKRERDVVYAAQIAPALTRLRLLARREAADTLRKVSDSALKLARPTSYTSAPGSQTLSQGTFTYSTLDTVLSDDLLYYTRSKSELDTLITDCDFELARLDVLIKENSMDEAIIKQKILAIPCFKKAGDAAALANIEDSANAAAGQPDCEKKARKKLGIDPLYLRTLSATDSSLPDLTSQCYWKEFAKALNKVCILPFPDISVPGANLIFRYWPINCILPIPFGLVLLPIPPRWKPLFVLPTPLGTLVCMLTMPLAPIGIPLPSLYLFFFAIDGNKYLAFATNPPLLYAPIQNLKFGFEQDNSALSLNPLGLNPLNPYKGQPIKGSLTVPLAVSAPVAKATRLASIAAMVAAGEISISNLAGVKLPVDITLPDLLTTLLSETEMMLGIANAPPSNDFKRQMTGFKTTVNRQLDKLGEMQTGAIVSIKESLSKAREAAEEQAYGEKDNSKRRTERKKARNLNITSLQDKIDAAIKSVNDHIDNIKFGTIRYPKDPTKFNPELPSALTAIFDVIELAAIGDFKIDPRATSLNAQLINILGMIDVKKLSSKTQFNLDDSKDLADFKDALKKLAGQAVGFLKGNKFDSNTSAAKNKEEAQAIADSAKTVQDTLKKALSLTAIALSVPIGLNIFDLAKKCCEVQAKNIFTGIPLPLTLAFTLITSLIESLVDAIDPKAILNSIGIPGLPNTPSNIVSLNTVTQVLEGILDSLPNVPIPDPAGLTALVTALIIPILSIISFPKAPTPIHLPSIPLIIPLDPILKPLIKALLAKLIEAIFRLLDQASNVLAKATATETSTLSQQSSTTSAANLNTATGGGVFGGNSEDNIKFLNEVFTTACGEGITASLSLESRLTSTSLINSAKTAEPAQDTIETTTTASSTVALTVTLPDGKVFRLPKIPFISLDLMGYFHLLTGADLIELVRGLFNMLFDQIINPISQIISIISLISTSANTLSYTTIEAAIPQISIIKLILLTIDSLIPPGFKIRPVNLEAMKVILAVAIPALEFAEPVLKQIAWIGSLALCAIGIAPLYSTVSIARLFHPIMNQDDLPPWERLTHKNPLFSIFLDEIAWRGSIYSTGSLIFQSKMPAVLPYTPLLPIVHISPHLA
jgi:hypothetical protein